MLWPQRRATNPRFAVARHRSVYVANQRGRIFLRGGEPRHYHEWKIWQDIELAEGKILIPGFIGHANSYVEHPELIADGIVNYAALVGRQNVIAGADCGFSSRASFAPEVHPSIVWKKFQALADGARLATKRLTV